MWQILSAVTDGEINTPEQARAVLDEETTEYARVLQIPADEARKMLKENLGYCSFYFTRSEALRVLELFDAEHPVYGREWPT